MDMSISISSDLVNDHCSPLFDVPLVRSMRPCYLRAGVRPFGLARLRAYPYFFGGNLAENRLVDLCPPLLQARLTKEQVDEFVEILLPICFEDAFFSEDEYSVCGAMQTLALLRPRSVIPHVIKSIEEGYSAPPVPLRLIKSLKVLASCSSSFCCPNVFPVWNHYIGFQPTDQIQNYPPDDVSQSACRKQ